MIKLAEMVDEIDKKMTGNREQIEKVRKSISIASDYIKQHFQSNLNFDDPW